jgi:hypothetical protein
MNREEEITIVLAWIVARGWTYREIAKHVRCNRHRAQLIRSGRVGLNLRDLARMGRHGEALLATMRLEISRDPEEISPGTDDSDF